MSGWNNHECNCNYCHYEGDDELPMYGPVRPPVYGPPTLMEDIGRRMNEEVYKLYSERIAMDQYAGAAMADMLKPGATFSVSFSGSGVKK